MSAPDYKVILPKIKKNKQSLRYLFNLIFLGIIILGLNYIGCSHYSKKDLTLDQRYSLSPQTLHLLGSSMLKDQPAPVKLILACRRNTLNYDRIRAILDDYTHLSGGQISLECVDPLRVPNRARELSNMYGLEFTENQLIIDARHNKSRSLTQADEHENEASRVRFLPCKSFVLYERTEDGKHERAVALQMEDMVTSALIGAMEGKTKDMYIIVDKSSMGKEQLNDPTSLYSTVEKITRQLNLQLHPIRISEIKNIPENASGVILIGPQYDLEIAEVEKIKDYWNRKSSALFIILDPASGKLRHLYSFLRENGIRPRADRVLRKGRTHAIYETNAIFSPGPLFTKDFWNSSTLLEGQTSSLKVEEGAEALAISRINAFPLLEAGSNYYGETKFSHSNVTFDAHEDYDKSLALAAAVEKGNPGDSNLAKTTSRMTIMTNMDLLNPKKLRPDQRDFVKSCFFWITDREELAGIGSRSDLTVKIDWDDKTKSVLELLIVVIMPTLALLMAFLIWRVRRS